MHNYLTIRNNEAVSLSSIPILRYDDFLECNTLFLKDFHNHCVSYFGYPEDNKLKLICCIANDNKSRIKVTSCNIELNTEKSYPSFSANNLAFNMFEREIAENFGINYSDHPWLKPLRYSFNRKNKTIGIADYPFYKIESEEIHEVGVGPIHAGIIEPGHFRFLCKGEQILHLEIQLGYQHRGIESLFIEKNSLLQKATLAESIAGDTAVGHSTAFANLWESLCGFTADEELNYVRTLALEIERIAIHTGDLSAICGDIAFLIGNSVYGRLRTPIINFFQQWCGNRLAKGLIRPGRNNFAFTSELRDIFLKILDAYEKDYLEMNSKFFHNPGSLSRLEKTGVFTTEQALGIGAVGMAARSSGLNRDVRLTHPCCNYSGLFHTPILKHHGDVLSRTQVRREEIMQSISYIRYFLEEIPVQNKEREPLSNPKPDTFILSLVEGWRGEICHCAITDANGKLAHYKIKDPSFHNWLALALAVRKNEISDFPVCNKSFNLSYSGFDL